MKRVFLIVLDSFGIGGMPDAEKFGDLPSCNTLKPLVKSNNFTATNLCKLGLSKIDGVNFLPDLGQQAAIARLAEASNGKDTTTGHWEIAGLLSEHPFPTFPDGFPEEILEPFRKMTGRGVLCNRPYSGTEVIRDFGQAHQATGDLIVYTSADSVFQIAAHEEVVPPEQLYQYCRMARSLLVGDYAVGRVIARPFLGEFPNYTRTARRHDFSVEPHGETLLDAICKSGKQVLSVGKISDIFAGRGISESIPTSGNLDGMQKTEILATRNFEGLCFVNLVDFDSAYGHRNDVDGYAAAVAEFDRWLGDFLPRLQEDDVLVITADHGCDPGDVSTDHTREYVPLLAVGKKIRPVNLGTRECFADIAATIAEWLSVPFTTLGKSFAREITAEAE